MTKERFFARHRNSLSDGPLVSVVTPFFNTADYLEECIQSVLRQTYKNWEYILVDNCSTDGSDKICEHYCASDARIRFVRAVEFLGQVENYNRALRYMSPESKYCKIVQADDWIYPHCLAEMVVVAESGEDVGLVSSFTLYGDQVSHGGLPLSRGPVYPGRDAARSQLLGKVLFGSPTCVMYRSDIVRSHDAFFPTSMPYFEDTEVCFQILQLHDFGFVPQILTFNRRDNESIWAGIHGFHPYSLHEVMFIHRFGPHFLDAEELARRIREAETVFYRSLVRGIMRSDARECMQFHTKGLTSAGLKVSYQKLILSTLSSIADAVLNPKRTIEALLRRLNQRWD